MMRGMLTLETTRWQYTHGAPDETQVAPEAYWLDYALMSRSGNDDIQLDLIGDYASNVALYPEIHAYFRDRRPPLLAVWGANDPFFLPAGAKAFAAIFPRPRCISSTRVTSPWRRMGAKSPITFATSSAVI
jgi:pimeloyl-ACP methyl ester carboxylesterase